MRRLLTQHAPLAKQAQHRVMAFVKTHSCGPASGNDNHVSVFRHKRAVGPVYLSKIPLHTVSHDGLTDLQRDCASKLSSLAFAPLHETDKRRPD